MPGPRHARALGPMLGTRRSAGLLAVGAGRARARQGRRADAARELDRPGRRGNCADRAGTARSDQRPCPNCRARRSAQPEQARFRLFESMVSFLRKAAETAAAADRAGRSACRGSDVPADAGRISRQIRGIRVIADRDLSRSRNEASTERAALIAQAEREGVALPAARPRRRRHRQVHRTSAWGVSAKAPGLGCTT